MREMRVSNQVVILIMVGVKIMMKVCELEDVLSDLFELIEDFAFD